MRILVYHEKPLKSSKESFRFRLLIKDLTLIFVFSIICGKVIKIPSFLVRCSLLRRDPYLLLGTD